MTFQVDTNIDILEIFRPISITDILTTKFCDYFSITGNLTLKATLIPLQRKTIANTSHNFSIIHKQQKKNTTI